jgi:NADH:ubiquinone oxidoreductase subunit
MREWRGDHRLLLPRCQKRMSCILIKRWRRDLLPDIVHLFLSSFLLYLRCVVVLRVSLIYILSHWEKKNTNFFSILKEKIKKTEESLSHYYQTRGRNQESRDHSWLIHPNVEDSLKRDSPWKEKDSLQFLSCLVPQVISKIYLKCRWLMVNGRERFSLFPSHNLICSRKYSQVSNSPDMA